MLFSTTAKHVSSSKRPAGAPRLAIAVTVVARHVSHVRVARQAAAAAVPGTASCRQHGNVPSVARQAHRFHYNANNAATSLLG